MIDHVAEDYLTAFQLRRAVCRELLSLSRRQATLIAADVLTELVDVLQSKQDLLEHLGQLSRDQLPLRTTWTARRDNLPVSMRERCDAVLTETEALLSVLLREEASSSSQLLARRDATQRELQSLSVGVQAQQAYQPRPPNVLSRIDLNS